MSAGAIIAAICVAAYGFLVHLIHRSERLEKEIAKRKAELEKEKIHAETKSMSNDELIGAINNELGRNDQK